MIDILDSIKTTQDKNKILAEIELVLDSIYKNTFNAVVSGQISKSLADFIGQDSPNNTASKLSELKNTINTLPMAKLTLAMEPSRDFLSQIVTYLRKNLNAQIIAEVKIDPAILGGVMFEFNGLYKDYTLKTKISELFKNNRISK